MLQDTIKTYKEKLQEAARLKTQSDERVAELEPEVERLAARCKELVQQKDITSEVGFDNRQRRVSVDPTNKVASVAPFLVLSFDPCASITNAHIC